jgi:SAM-dependent methyltransferase
MSSNPVRDLDVAENYPMDSQTMTSNLLQLKQAIRATWMAADFGQIARYMEKEAAAFVERRSIIHGMKVLDVACATGNVAVPAARKGAQVVGIDIEPNLLEQARHRAVAESLEATFEEGNAEQLPYPGHFDVVANMFGATFSPRPEHWHGCVYPHFYYLCKRGLARSLDLIMQSNKVHLLSVTMTPSNGLRQSSENNCVFGFTEHR